MNENFVKKKIIKITAIRARTRRNMIREVSEEKND
jgi:hypothetical protein